MAKSGKINGYLVLIIILSVIAIRMIVSNRKAIERYDEMFEIEGDINWQNWGEGYREKILSKETTCLELLKMLSEVEDLNYRNLAPADYNEVWIFIDNQYSNKDCN